MTIPEIVAVVTGVLSVWYARKESVLVYPVGIISVLLYVYICLEVKLYADAAINAYYFVVSLYGWYFWLYGGGKAVADRHAHITILPFRRNVAYALITLLLGALFGWLLHAYTDSTVPYWDGGTTAIFCMAMFLMARKNIEHWIYWIIGDIICIPLFFSKGLCLSSLQYLIFTLLAIAGFISWKKTLSAQHH